MAGAAQPGSFGELLREHRLDAGLTQAVLAERAGLSVRAVQHLERSLGQPQRETTRRLVQALALTSEQLARFELAAAPSPRMRVAPDRRADSPSPAPSDTRPHKLPVQATRLIGRQQEARALHDQLTRDHVRLVTLSGAPGTGKTHLSLQVTAEVVRHFPDGAFFIALAPITNPELVPTTIAQVLEIRGAGGRPVMDSLKEHLRDRQILLVLDNFEHIMRAAPLVAELLEASRGLKVLVTSRVPLELRGEHELPVPPLALPDPKRLPGVDALARYGAVALFIERATAIRPDFSLTTENAPAVAEICVRLDGLPLAIELAATRTRMLSPQALLARLERRLPMLTGGARDLPARQQTLRSAISWSYDLLDESERALFRRLAIFVGGFTLEAAGAVCGSEGMVGVDVLDGVASLVAKSLVRELDRVDEPRFGMLETIREYGLEQLDVSGEAEATRRAHATYFLALVEEAEPKLLGREQLVWVRRLDLEHDNLRAVLGWSRDGAVEGDVGLKLVGALHWFWMLRGFAGEGRGWTEAMLGRSAVSARTVTRARALYTAAALAYTQGDYAAGRTLARESVAICRERGDLQGVARALVRQGLTELSQGDVLKARSLIEESAALARDVGDRYGLAFALTNLGALAQNEGDYAAAGVLRAQSAAIAREIGERDMLGRALLGLAFVARMQDEHADGPALWREGLVVTSELDDRWLMLRALAGLAGVAIVDGHHGWAVRVFGAVEALRQLDGTREPPVWRTVNDRDVAGARAALGDEMFAAAWAQGRAMSLEQVVAYALAGPAPTR